MKKSKKEKESELEEDVGEGLDEIVIKEISKDSASEIEFPNQDEDISRFNEFMNSSFNIAPSLERVTSRQQIPEINFEEQSEQQRTEQRDNFDEIKKYDVIGEESRRIYEIKTQRNSGSSIEPQMIRTTDNIKQQFLNPLAGRNFNFQDDMEPNVIETRTSSRERKLPFEEKERKYRQVKL